MPERYVEDETVQCTMIPKTRYVSKILLPDYISPGPLSATRYTAYGATDVSFVEDPVAYALITNTEGTDPEVSVEFTPLAADRPVEVITNFVSTEQYGVAVTMIQNDSNNTPREIGVFDASTTSGEVRLAAQTISTNPITVLFRGTSGNSINIGTISYVEYTQEQHTYSANTCNMDPDFGADYRFGYSGAEKDNEVSGTGNHLDYGARGRDPRLGGGWWSVDPKAAKMPGWSPYAFCFNNPILFVDPDGEYPIVTITKQKAGTTLQRVIGYTGSSKQQYTRVNLYKVTVTDTEDKNFKMSFTVTRDAFAVRKGDAKNGNMTLTNVAFEPKDGNINHYTGKPMEYPAGDGTKALKLTQYGSEVMHAEANDASVELGYRTKSDVAAGVMIHVGGVYEHSDGSTSCAASEGCFGVTDGNSSSSNPSNDYSNKVIGSIIDQANKSKTNKGKIEVIIEKRSSSERVNTKTEKQQ